MHCNEELELDIGPIFMTVYVEYDLTEGEPEVRYGNSPQPGCPPTIEITEVDVTSVSGETYDLSGTELCNKTGWWYDLNRIARKHIEGNEGLLEDLMQNI